METEPTTQFPVALRGSFFANCEFRKKLVAGKTSDVRTFRLQCREGKDRLIFVLVGRVSVTSMVSRFLSSFCHEVLLEGNSSAEFSLFSDLYKVLRTCVLSLDEGKADMEEFTSYVVEKRRQHVDSDQSTSENSEIMNYLLRDFTFQYRHHVLRIFKVCCLVVNAPRCALPSVTIDLSESALDANIPQNRANCLVIRFESAV